MNLHEWNSAYVTLNNKINKKFLNGDEVEQLVELLASLRAYLDKIGWEVMKRQ